jgi:hypothetical protein
MRVAQNITLTLSGIDSSSASHATRLAVADAIFKSLKYNVSGTPQYDGDDGVLGDKYIEKIDLDGEWGIVTQYLWTNIASGPKVTRKLVLEDEVEDEDNDEYSRLLSTEHTMTQRERDQFHHREQLGYYSKHARALRKVRNLSLTWVIQATFFVVSNDRYLADWQRTVDILLERLEENINTKIFDSYMYNASIANRGIDRDFTFDGHWSDVRRRSLSGDLATASASAVSVSSTSLDAYSLYGNAPSGMPTVAPSSSAPTTVKVRLTSQGLYEPDRTVSILSLLPYIVLWCAGIALFAGYSLLDGGYNYLRKVMGWDKATHPDDELEEGGGASASTQKGSISKSKKLAMMKKNAKVAQDPNGGGSTKVVGNGEDDNSVNDDSHDKDDGGDGNRLGIEFEEEDEEEFEIDDKDPAEVEKYLLKALGMDQGMYQPDPQHKQHDEQLRVEGGNAPHSALGATPATAATDNTSLVPMTARGGLSSHTLVHGGSASGNRSLALRKALSHSTSSHDRAHDQPQQQQKKKKKKRMTWEEVKAFIAKWVPRIWFDMGVFHPVLLWLNISNFSPTNGRNFDLIRVSWNRAVRGAFMLCYFSFAFMVLSLLLLIQYPSDDFSCLRHTDQDSCESIYKYYISVHTYCEWLPGEEGIGLNYCGHRVIQTHDDSVLILSSIITALCCAPLTFAIEYYFRLLLVDQDSPNADSVLSMSKARSKEKKSQHKNKNEKQSERKAGLSSSRTAKIVVGVGGLAMTRDRLNRTYFKNVIASGLRLQEKEDEERRIALEAEIQASKAGEGILDNREEQKNEFDPLAITEATPGGEESKRSEMKSTVKKSAKKKRAKYLQSGYQLLEHFFHVLPHHASTMSEVSTQSVKRIAHHQNVLKLMEMVSQYRGGIAEGRSRQAFDALMGIEEVARADKNSSATETKALSAALGGFGGYGDDDDDDDDDQQNFEFVPFLSPHGRDWREPWEIWASFLFEAAADTGIDASNEDGDEDENDIIGDGSVHIPGTSAAFRGSRWRRALCEAQSLFNAMSAFEAKGLISSRRAITVRRRVARTVRGAEEQAAHALGLVSNAEESLVKKPRGGHMHTHRHAQEEEEEKELQQEREEEVRYDAERLAQAVLGVEILRLLFEDLLGRARRSAEASIVRQRLDTLLPARHSGHEWRNSTLVYVIVAALLANLTCFAVTLSSIMFCQNSFFYAWYLACLFYVVVDLSIVQSNISLFLATVVPAFHREKVEQIYWELSASCRRLWTSHGPPEYHNGSDKLKSQTKSSAAPGSYHSSKGMQTLMNHVFVSSKLAKAHPLMLESRIVDIAEAEFVENLHVDALLIEQQANTRKEHYTRIDAKKMKHKGKHDSESKPKPKSESESDTMKVGSFTNIEERKNGPAGLDPLLEDDEEERVGPESNDPAAATAAAPVALSASTSMGVAMRIAAMKAKLSKKKADKEKAMELERRTDDGEERQEEGKAEFGVVETSQNSQDFYAKQQSGQAALPASTSMGVAMRIAAMKAKLSKKMADKEKAAASSTLPPIGGAILPPVSGSSTGPGDDAEEGTDAEQSETEAGAGAGSNQEGPPAVVPLVPLAPDEPLKPVSAASAPAAGGASSSGHFGSSRNGGMRGSVLHMTGADSMRAKLEQLMEKKAAKKKQESKDKRAEEKRVANMHLTKRVHKEQKKKATKPEHVRILLYYCSSFFPCLCDLFPSLSLLSIYYSLHAFSDIT